MNYLAPENKYSTGIYQRLVRLVLGIMFNQMNVVTGTELAEYTVDKSNKICYDIEVIFLTKEQQTVFGNNSLKRVIFGSDYGTGKTTLLLVKALCQSGIKKEALDEFVNEEYPSPPKKPNFGGLEPMETEDSGPSAKVFLVIFLTGNHLLVQKMKRISEKMRGQITVLNPQSTG